MLIPAFDRPEMVWLCLDHLAACPEAREVEVRVCVDGRAGHAPIDEFVYVVAQHPTLTATIHVGPSHRYHGNSFNVLRSFQAAVTGGFDWIYLVEDDVLVRPEFFQWHQRFQREYAVCLAATIGVADPGHGAYASLGVCLDRGVTNTIAAHGHAAYFSDMRGYCRRTFPASPFDCEQDGLIARVLAGCTVVWADPPVCSHVGWYGYHRTQGARPRGTLAERYAQVRATVALGLTAAAHGAKDVALATTPNTGTYTLSTVPGGAA